MTPLARVTLLCLVMTLQEAALSQQEANHDPPQLSGNLWCRLSGCYSLSLDIQVQEKRQIRAASAMCLTFAAVATVKGQSLDGGGSVLWLWEHFASAVARALCEVGTVARIALI